ncbi:hypothetical protein BEN47_02160 [Hymenobacter lapidarius]|uniref:STAS/SEC14 domain-containing protein n=1 Tax=Hymenobacter lapidarius TaxID=1908237 RepID=A0A1G1T2Q1_9BACT|nr:hypothetical protein BEN47_02160 [Hymenobacter lapidarius]
MLNQSRLSTLSLPSLPFFPVTCREGSTLLRGRTRRALTAEEITRTCEVLLAAAIRRRCAFWLLDGRVNTTVHPAELHEWLQEDYFPRVRVQLGQPPCIALLVAPCLWQDMFSMGLDAPAQWPTWSARVGWFKEERDALAWLRHQGAQARTRLQLAGEERQPLQAGQYQQLSFNF